MSTSRRDLLKGALVPLLLPLLGGNTAAAAQLSDMTDIRIIQPKDAAGMLERLNRPGFDIALGNAVLAFISASYATGTMPVWKKPLSQVDMATRVSQIARNVVLAVTRHATVYPVDPCWIMAQIMAESFFNEFAVSSALAVGPCQFIAPTARGYGMLCADAHLLPPGQVQRPDLEPAFAESARLREQMRSVRKEHAQLFSNPSKLLRTVLQAQAAGTPVPNAVGYLQTLDQMDVMQARYAQTRDNAKQFLLENFQNRSIFNPQDVAFFEQFEQRVLYRFSVDAMVRLMADNMRARGGNILAATAGYNAGLGTTDYEWGVYAMYGRVPGIDETVDYVSKILINHHEISRRM